MEKVVLRIERDDSPESPREWGNLGTFLTWQRRYNSPDKNDYSDPRSCMESLAYDYTDRNTYDMTDKQIQRIVEKHYIILPVYVYEHSSIAFSVHSFSDPWDSGQAGFIYVSKEDARKEYGVKRLTAKVRAKVEKVLESEVEVYGQWVNGDVWGFVLEDDKGDTIDACWGFYGSDPRENGMDGHIEEKYHFLFDKLDEVGGGYEAKSWDEDEEEDED